MITKKETKVLREFTEFIGQQNEEALTYDELMGFLHGLAMTPEIIMPSEWIEAIFGDEEPEFLSKKQMENFVGNLMQVYNKFLSAFQNDKLEFPFDFTNPPPLKKVDEWVWGLNLALQMRPMCWLGEDNIIDMIDGIDEDEAAEEFEREASEEDKERMACLSVVATIANPEEAEQYFISRSGDELAEDDEFWARLYAMLPSAVEYLQKYAAEQEHLRKQEFLAEKRNPVPQPAAGSKKIGRNDPCPCGSGKKYKKCCLLKEKVVPIR